ncbi:pyridoxamine 5'-phosphate oxidase family protein [Nonomuraea dietziae]|uniref:pyridoxamine 5'-phosphate oxidase family protein n=1 Tax=Nonomuraea dietziae TaxID=65515 RepID=UPI0031DF11D6
MTLPAARTFEQRRLDTLHRLEHDVDAWVATAGPEGGEPYMVPLSFLWDGDTLLFATAADSATARNLEASGKARLGLGPHPRRDPHRGYGRAAADGRGPR